jgi:hypothetical protein
MRSGNLIALTLAAISIPAFGVAQDKSRAATESTEVQQNTKTATNSGTDKTSRDTVYGQVESFEAGKSLKVTVPGKVVNTKSFSLDSNDWTYKVPNNLKVGDWVKVREMTASNGHKTLTVQHSAKRPTS